MLPEHIVGRAWHVDEWVEDGKRVPVAGYGQVLEDGKDVCDSESDPEYGDHGEQWSYSEMYTPEMLGPDGKPKAGPPRLTTARRPAPRIRNHGVQQGQTQFDLQPRRTPTKTAKT
jgi:hypothetical protein